MTIIEAIKSQKPFKRAKWNGWFVVVGDRICEIGGNQNRATTTLKLYVSDIVTDDWEIKSDSQG